MKKLLLSSLSLGAFALLLTFTISSCSNSTTPSTSNDVVGGVYTTSSTPFGSTYAQWSAKWWQWAFMTPVHDVSTLLVTHPLRDAVGVEASNGQDVNSSVFFLGGTIFGNGTISRTVTIPASKAIFFPILNVEGDTTNAPTWNADSVNAAVTAVSAVPVTLTATLDGNAIPNLTAYKVRSDAFSVTLPNDNIYQFENLTYPAGTVVNPIVSFGYWIMLAPLAKGTHVLHFTGDAPAVGAMQDITYNITSN